MVAVLSVVHPQATDYIRQNALYSKVRERAVTALTRCLHSASLIVEDTVPKAVAIVLLDLAFGSNFHLTGSTVDRGTCYRHRGHNQMKPECGTFCFGLFKNSMSSRKGKRQGDLFR